MRATSAQMVVRNAQPSTLPLLPASQLSSEFFHQLARADLTAVGYQVLFWHMERLIRHRTTSEAVPLETLAQALGLHRNAVGKAYTALTAAGLVRRQEVPQRGAPTRTCIEGLALQVVLQASGQRARPTPVTGTRHMSVPTGTGGASQLGQQSAIQSAPPDREASAAMKPSTSEVTQDTPSILPVSTYSPELVAQALAKLPNPARYDALQGTLTSDAIEPSWDLSDEERSCVLNMKRHEAKPHMKPAVCVKPVPTKAPKAVATALMQHRAEFEALVEGGALSHLGQAELDAMKESGSLIDAVIDQIAFTICKCGLGRGDVYAGVRGARSLLAKGRWTLPWTFTRDWYGAVQRSAERAS